MKADIYLLTISGANVAPIETVASIDPATVTEIPAAKNKTSPPWWVQIIQCIVVAVLATFSYLLISRYILQSVQVVGASMSPTLQDSDRYFLNRWVYDLREPRRG